MKPKKKEVGGLDASAGKNGEREAWLAGIMSEFAEATERLDGIGPAVSLFGSARVPRDHPYFVLAETIARQLSDAGFSVISGGGPGIMEASNRGAHFGKSPSVGLNIELPREQIGNTYQDVSVSFRHFFARKVSFVRLACAYVVLPGGFGTLDEITEALALVQTGKTPSAPLILVHEPFWRGLIDWLRERLLAEGMITASELSLIQVLNEPAEVVDVIVKHYAEHGAPPPRREVMLSL